MSKKTYQNIFVFSKYNLIFMKTIKTVKIKMLLIKHGCKKKKVYLPCIHGHIHLM